MRQSAIIVESHRTRIRFHLLLPVCWWTGQAGQGVINVNKADGGGVSGALLTLVEGSHKSATLRSTQPTGARS